VPYEYPQSEAVIRAVRDGRTTYHATTRWLYRKTGVFSSRLEILSKRRIVSVRFGRRGNHQLAALAGLSLSAALALSWLSYPLTLLGISAAVLALSGKTHYIHVRFHQPGRRRRYHSWVINGSREELQGFLRALTATSNPGVERGVKPYPGFSRSRS
jgi:hypothetical protein